MNHISAVNYFQCNVNKIVSKGVHVFQEDYKAK